MEEVSGLIETSHRPLGIRTYIAPSMLILTLIVESRNEIHPERVRYTLDRCRRK